jgi:hypothetical protein
MQRDFYHAYLEFNLSYKWQNTTCHNSGAEHILLWGRGGLPLYFKECILFFNEKHILM